MSFPIAIVRAEHGEGPRGRQKIETQATTMCRLKVTNRNDVRNTKLVT